MKHCCLSFFIVVFIIGFALTSIWYALFLPENSDSTATEVFTVKDEETLAQVAENLKNAGLIRRQFVFEKLMWWKGGRKEIPTGIYELSGSYSTRHIANLLFAGFGQSNETYFTVIEGWRNVDVAEMFDQRGMFKQKEFLDIAGWPATYYLTEKKLTPDYRDKFEWLADKPENVGLEGYLYPDTYRVFKTASAQNVMEKMLKNFDGKLTPELRDEIKRQNKTVFEVVILASVVEKEAATTEDRRIVADVFAKRLAAGMPLQSDATVNYATKKSELRPSAADLSVDNPYNTYKYAGLPVAPIGNPSLDAIRAVLYPIKNDYWYFLATPDGTVIYSKTYEEHLENVGKYLK